MEQALDPLCLLFVDVDPQSLLKIVGGSFSPVLIENEWQPFLVKIRNRSIRDVHVTVRAKGQVDNKWIKVKPGSEDRTLIAPGEIEVEYRLVLLQSSEVGKREASLTVLVGDGQGDASSWSTADVAFQTLPSTLEGAEGSVTLGDGLHVRIVDRVVVRVDATRELHGPTVTRTATGDLLLCHQDPDQHHGGDGSIRQLRSRDNGFTWQNEGFEDFLTRLCCLADLRSRST